MIEETENKMQINTKFNVGDLVYHIYTTVTCEEIGDGTYYKPIWIKILSLY